MEIERKFLIDQLPDHLDSYPHDTIRQAYVCTSPVIRVRQKNDVYILTLKSGGLMARQEVEMEIGQAAFEHLLGKADGIVIEKVRYKLPDGKGHTIELDIFHGDFEGFIMAEIEFASIEEAEQAEVPSWFGKDVTFDGRFHNSHMSGLSKREATLFVAMAQAMASDR